MNLARRDNKIGVAVVGCGYWGVNYIRVFEELSDATVIAICDRRKERLEEATGHISTASVTTDLGRVLGNEDVHAVVVCSEAAQHFNIARACLDAGKHVLIEKPMTASIAEAEELEALAKSSRLVFMVGHTFLYNNGIRKVKELMNHGERDVYYMHARRTNLGPIRTDVDAVWDLATHDIAIFDFLLDSAPVSVSAVGARALRNCRVDVAFISLFYPNGVLGNIHVSWADPNKARELVVVCSDRRIVFNDLNSLEQVRVFHKGISPVPPEPSTFGEHQLQIRDGDIVSPRIPPSEPLKNQCKHFLDCVMTGAAPLTGARDGTVVVTVLESVERSMSLCGAEVRVDSHVKFRAQAAAA